MSLNRRQFVLVSAVACGCRSATDRAGSGSDLQLGPKDVDGGPMTQYASDGVYDSFRERGFFIVRRQGRMIALSSICTHRGCKISSTDNQSYVCRCHGSRFDSQGHVTKGPASRDLPAYQTTVDQRNHLIVHMGKPAPAAAEKV